MTDAPTFTAARLAQKLHLTVQAVRLRLVDFPADGSQIVRGQNSKSWSLAALPGKLRAEIGEAARQNGFRCAEDFLADEPAAQWMPKIPWHAIGPAHRNNADKFRNALSGLLHKQHEVPGPELFRLAAIACREFFGRELPADRVRYVMDRATKRDKGALQFNRPELYLDDAAFQEAPAVAIAKTDLHAPLDRTIANLGNLAEYENWDRAELFHAAFVHFEKLISENPRDGRNLKQSIIAHLVTVAPGLYRPKAGTDATAGKPKLAIRRCFNTLYPWWTANGKTILCLQDHRVGNVGRPAYSCAKCDTMITAHAARLRGAHGEKGNLDLAIKLLSEKNELCARCNIQYRSGRISKKSRDRLTPNAIQVANIMRGADGVRDVAPTHHTQWDTTPGDRIVLDDMTTNELGWDEVEGKIISGQVQFLAGEDEFSAYPLPFLMFFGHPNSFTILKHIELILRTVGLPHLSLLIERGAYASRKIAGERSIRYDDRYRELEAALKTHINLGDAPADLLGELRQRELGLRDPAFHLKIRHAYSPQAKTIERSFYTLQQSTSRLPGFSGFNQRNEKSRALQDFDRRVASGKEHPGNEYLHLSDLRKNYETIQSEIANRPVNGIRHRGRTPDDVWQEALSARPLRKLPPEIEALLCVHRVPQVTVRPQGICVSLDKFEDAFYFNEHTGPLVGRKLAIRRSVNTDDYIYLEHPDTGKLLKVGRSLTMRTTATSEEIATVNHARKAHIKGALAQIGQIPNLFTKTIIRDYEHAPADIAQGAQVAADAAEHKAEQSAKNRKLRKVRTDAAAAGIALPTQVRNPDRVSRGVELGKAARERIAQKKLASPTAATGHE